MGGDGNWGGLQVVDSARAQAARAVCPDKASARSNLSISQRSRLIFGMNAGSCAAAAAR
jgi:hypothetical protein